MTFYPKTFNGVNINKFSNEDSKANDLGTDYSTDYARNKGAVIYFANYWSERVVSFKAFISSYKVGISNEISEDDDFWMKKKILSVKMTNLEYNITLDVPSHSVNGAMTNLAKFQELARYITPGNGERSSKTYVLLANLIHNGKYVKKTEVAGYEEVETFGARCNLAQIDFDPDLEMGFFEYDNKLLPKSYKVSLKLNVYVQIWEDGDDTGKKLIRGFDNTTGEYDSNDIQTWPCGVGSFGTVSEYQDSYSDVYANAKTAKIGICQAVDNSDKYVVFKLFLENFKFTTATNHEIKPLTNDGMGFNVVAGGRKEMKYAFSFNVLAGSIVEAISNLSKFQALARMIVKRGQTAGAVRVYMANLISAPGAKHAFGSTLDKSFISSNGRRGLITSIDFQPDLEMGFFDNDGLFLAKSFKIDIEFSDTDPLVVNEFMGTEEGGDYELGGGDIGAWPFGIDYDSKTSLQETASSPAGASPDGGAPSVPDGTTPEEDFPDTQIRVSAGQSPLNY